MKQLRQFKYIRALRVIRVQDHNQLIIRFACILNDPEVERVRVV